MTAERGDRQRTEKANGLRPLMRKTTEAFCTSGGKDGLSADLTKGECNRVKVARHRQLG